MRNNEDNDIYQSNFHHKSVTKTYVNRNTKVNVINKGIKETDISLETKMSTENHGESRSLSVITKSKHNNGINNNTNCNRNISIYSDINHNTNKEEDKSYNINVIYIPLVKPSKSDEE